jgi:hypothetical protein
MVYLNELRTWVNAVKGTLSGNPVDDPVNTIWLQRLTTTFSERFG